MSEKIGNWKIKFEKLENKMERTLEKIAGSSPVCIGWVGGLGLIIVSNLNLS